MRFVVLSTTSKHKKEFIHLPDKKIFNKYEHNFLVSNLNKLKEIINRYNNLNTYFLLDCEKKQNISLYDEVSIDNKIDYKPNDLTMESADLAILNFFDRNINGKSIGIYGTGNIAFKLALRLSERNANIFLYGRNEEKVKKCIDTLKQITFDKKLIHWGTYESEVNCLVSCVSADEAIEMDFLNILTQNSLCLDVGIGNFSKEFIEKSLKKGHEVRRLDVRQSQEIMDGYINSRLNSEFDNIIGKDLIKDHSVVAGGIMGIDGEIIIDRIKKPTKVIGIANGIGGVKNESELSNREREKIQQVQSYIEQSI